MVMNSRLKLIASARLPHRLTSPAPKPSAGTSRNSTQGWPTLAQTSAKHSPLAKVANSSSTALTLMGAGLSAKQMVSAPLASGTASAMPPSALPRTPRTRTPTAETRPLVK
ncbi:hypothetical protein GALL_345150 [mine drainage metagenome]|uniref:Uncharacterized protein n=1 Tax=mine drainage metagenome TaxID=410659 RepID=A0A1J5R6B2_9ZZZZ